MSDTPRTDALTSKACERPPLTSVVSADFARTLEREFAAKDATIARLEKALGLSADTLADASRTFKLFGKETAALAMTIAEQHSRAALNQE